MASSSSTFSSATATEEQHDEHDRIHSVCLHPSLQLVALGCESRIRLWSLKTNIKLKDLIHPGSVLSVEFDPQGRFLATAGSQDIGVDLGLDDDLINSHTLINPNERKQKENEKKKKSKNDGRRLYY